MGIIEGKNSGCMFMMVFNNFILCQVLSETLGWDFMVSTLMGTLNATATLTTKNKIFA